MDRISVVGGPGTGKTTLGRELGRRLGLPTIELDELHWGAGWQEVPTEVFRDRVRAATAGDRWVCDGNYTIVRDIVLPRADTLVWLDLPFGVGVGRTIRRTVRRAVTREPIFSGNVESWRTMLGPSSLIWWAIRTHRGRRRRWEAWLRRPEAAHLRVVRLRSTAEVAAWLTAVAPSG